MIKTTSKKRSRKYFAPQNEGVIHKCEHPDCNKPGEFKAPKDKTLKEYHWFCLEHVQEYNSKWNYYAGEGDSPEQETFKRRTRFTGFHSKIKYKFGCDLEDDLDFLHGFTGYDKAADSVRFSKKDREDIDCLELSSENLTKENLKKQYKKLAKTCHPDLHPNDKDAEEKFKRLTTAYKELLEKLS